MADLETHGSGDETMSGGDDGYNEMAMSPAASTLEADLAMIMATPFIIANTRIGNISRATARPLWVRFKQGGAIRNRMYQSSKSWGLRMKAAVRDTQPIRVLEIDEWGRLKSLFPTEVCARLRWNATHIGDISPVARFYDPNGRAEMLLLRSRCDGHAVDVVHNLTDGGLVRQALWIVDIMRLSPLLGIKLVRDEHFR